MKSETVLVRMLAVAGIASLLLVAGCGGGASPSSTNPPSSGSNPTPTITAISPNSAVAGGAAFTLTINGTNFVAASTVNFGGSATATTFVDSTQLTAAIPAASIAAAGMPAVTVTNSAPGGGTSKAVDFTIIPFTPSAGINSLWPSCAPAGSLPSFAGGLVVSGSNFMANSVVRWNGADQPTTYRDGQILAAQISASEIAAAGTAAITVFNPGPDGGSSNSLPFTITTGVGNLQSIAVDPIGKFAYVASTGCEDLGYVSIYTINSTTGTLASVEPSVPTNDSGTNFVTVDPLGRFVYVTNWGDWEDSDGSVSPYTINPTTGALTIGAAISGDSPGFCCFNSVTVHPSGKFAYVSEGSNVSMYTINATTGNLTSIGNISAGGAGSVAVDPSGKFAYATGSNNVSMYTVDATTGALASIGTIAAGTNPVSVAVDPSGEFVYVTNLLSNDISMYTVDTTTGALASIGTIAAGTGPVSIAVDPSGKFAYVADSTGSNTDGSVSMYTIDAATGTLSPSGTIATELYPTSIAIHPSGKFAYVVNSGSNSVSMYSIDRATGTLTLIGTIGT